MVLHPACRGLPMSGAILTRSVTGLRLFVMGQATARRAGCRPTISVYCESTASRVMAGFNALEIGQPILAV